MFGNLFGKKEEDTNDHVFKDRAYMTTAGKMKACADLAKADEKIIFIAWFSETAKQFRNYFTENNISAHRIIEANQFHTSQLVSQTPVFVEHYPLHSKEESFVKNWEGKKILVFSAMDEALFKHFGSEKLIPFMKMMGMKETEVIEHNMVSKSTIKGQHRIEEQVSVEQPANSQAEWMERNMK